MNPTTVTINQTALTVGSLIQDKPFMWMDTR